MGEWADYWYEADSVDVALAVRKVQRPAVRDMWLPLGGWRTGGVTFGEALLAGAKEGA